MGIEIRFIDKDGVDKGALPDVASLDISPVLGDYGTISFSYPRNGKKFHLIRDLDEFEVSVYVDGTHRPSLGGIVKEISSDDVLDDSLHEFSGLMYLTLMDEGMVYPYAWPSYSPTDVNHKLPDAKAGYIMLYFINLCKARGALSRVGTSTFTATHDSNGQPWTKQISLVFKPGVALTEVLKSLQANGLCEFIMDGTELKLYNPEGFSQDRTLTNPPLVFRRGRDLRDSPRKTTSRDLATVMLAAGNEDRGVYHEEVNPAAVAARRRIEGYVSNGNIYDVGTLEVYSELELNKKIQARMEKTHGLEFAEKNSPRPLVHFNVGDWAFSDVGRGMERLRIKQWTLSLDNTGHISGSVVMNDLFAEATERLSRKIDGILGGASVTGASQAEEAPLPPEASDGIAPATPTGLAVVSGAYQDDLGQTFSAVTASWVPVTKNSDNTPINDLQSYGIRWGSPGNWSWIAVMDPSASSISWSPVSAGLAIEVQINATDKWGNTSPWSALVPHTTSVDDAPPGAPSTPTMGDYLGLLEISWNGLLDGNLPLPADFSHVEIHVSSVNNFTPSESTLVGQLRRKGVFMYQTPYGSLRYGRLVLVDYSGNKSSPSGVASGSTAQVVSADIFDGAVGSAKLADLAVTTAKINDLAVNNAKIGGMNVGKLEAGTINVQILMAGSIKTAETGARVEFDSVGIFRYGSSNELTFRVDNSGVLVTGIYKSAIAGRRVEIGQSGFTGSIQFIGAAVADADGYVKGRTDGAFAYIEMGLEGWKNPNARQDGVESRWDYIAIKGSTTASSQSAATYKAGSHSMWIGNPQTGELGSWSLYVDNNQGSTGGTFLSGLSWGGTGFYIKPHLASGESAISVVGNGANNNGLSDAGATVSLENSPRMIMRNGNNVAGVLKFYYPVSGASNPAFEVRNGNDTAFYVVRAALFETSSDAGTKENIRDVSDVDFLLKVKSARVKRYRRKADNSGLSAGKKGRKGSPDTPSLTPDTTVFSDELGLIAQEAPPEILGSTSSDGMMTISLNAQVNVLWGAVQQLAGMIEELKRGAARP